MKNLKQRLTSVFMAVVMTAASATFIAETPVLTYAEGTPLEKNNMVYSDSGYVENLENIVPDDCSRPDYQAIRISLIEANGNVDTGGKIVTGNGIVNNPVSLWNADVAEQFNSDNPLSMDKVRQLVNPTRYQDGDYSVSNNLNTRRDYTSGTFSDFLLAYGMVWRADSPGSSSGTWVKSSDSVYQSAYVPFLKDSSIPLLIDGGGSVKSLYQQNPPEGYSDWSSMDNREFFDAYTQTAFISSEASSYGVTQPIPDFIVRVIYHCMGLSGSPYSGYKSNGNLDTILSYYQTYIASGEVKVLVEPLLVFENTGENSIVNVYFGEGVKYIALSSAEVGVLDDAGSGVNYGYTNKKCRETDAAGGNDYNFFTAPDSPTAQACNNLFNSQLLQTSDWSTYLRSMYDDGVTNSSNLGLRDIFYRYVNQTSSTNDNFLDSGTLGSALDQTAQPGDGMAHPYFESIFYKQVAKDIFGGTDEDTARNYNLSGYNDPASMTNIGGMSIINPVYSTIDIQATLTGVNDPEEEVNGIPVYKDSYSLNSDGESASITFKAGMSLNFEDGATSWNDGVVTNSDNGATDRERTADLTYLKFGCSKASDSGEYRWVKDSGSLTTYRIINLED